MILAYSAYTFKMVKMVVARVTRCMARCLANGLRGCLVSSLTICLHSPSNITATAKQDVLAQPFSYDGRFGVAVLAQGTLSQPIWRRGRFEAERFDHINYVPCKISLTRKKNIYFVCVIVFKRIFTSKEQEIFLFIINWCLILCSIPNIVK